MTLFDAEVVVYPPKKSERRVRLRVPNQRPDKSIIFVGERVNFLYNKGTLKTIDKRLSPNIEDPPAIRKLLYLISLISLIIAIVYTLKLTSTKVLAANKLDSMAKKPEASLNNKKTLPIIKAPPNHPIYTKGWTVGTHQSLTLNKIPPKPKGKNQK